MSSAALPLYIIIMISAALAQSPNCSTGDISVFFSYSYYYVAIATTIVAALLKPPVHLVLEQ